MAMCPSRGKGSIFTQLIKSLQLGKTYYRVSKRPEYSHQQKNKNRVLNHVIFRDTLFRKFVNGNLLTYLRESEAYIALTEVHEGICGAHQAVEKMK